MVAPLPPPSARGAFAHPAPVVKKHENQHDGVQRKRLLERAFGEFKKGDLKMARTLAKFLCEAYADSDAYAILAASCHKLGEEREASDAYLHALQTKPDDLFLHVGFAELCINMVRYEEAAAHLKRCIELDPVAKHPAGAKARVLVLKVEEKLTAGHH